MDTNLHNPLVARHIVRLGCLRVEVGRVFRCGSFALVWRKGTVSAREHLVKALFLLKVVMNSETGQCGRSEGSIIGTVKAEYDIAI